MKSFNPVLVLVIGASGAVHQRPSDAPVLVQGSTTRTWPAPSVTDQPPDRPIVTYAPLWLRSDPHRPLPRNWLPLKCTVHNIKGCDHVEAALAFVS